MAAKIYFTDRGAEQLLAATIIDIKVTLAKVLTAALTQPDLKSHIIEIRDELVKQALEEKSRL